MNSHISRIATTAVVVMSAIFAITLTTNTTSAYEIPLPEPTECTSGTLTARLTGWTLNNVLPKGSATYDAAAKRLKVTVTSVKLDEGTALNVEADGEKAGSLPALKDGSAEMSFSFAKALNEGDRVRVIDDDRPIVSGNLVCSKAEAKPKPAETPEPKPTPEASPSAANSAA